MAEVQQRAAPDTLRDPHYGDPDVKEHSATLAQHGLSAEERQQKRFARAQVYYEQGLYHEAKRDLLIASRLDIEQNRVGILVLLAKVLSKEGHAADAVTLLTEVWRPLETLENKPLIEEVVLILGELSFAAGGLPMVILVIDIGMRIDKYTEDCRLGMLKLVHDLLQVDVPADQVPHLATVISRFYRETDENHYQPLRRGIKNTVVRLAHIDAHAPIEHAVAVGSLMPLLAGRLAEGADDQLFRVENPSVWHALSQGAFFSALEEFDVPQRARLVRFAKMALDASADRQYNQKMENTVDYSIAHSRLIATWSVLRRITEAIDSDGSLKRLQKK